MRPQRYGKRHRGKRYGKSEDGFFIEKVARIARNKSAPRLSVATSHEIMYARKYTTYIHNIGL